MAAGAPGAPARRLQSSSIGILFALSISHLLNDAIQALIPSIYPLIKESLHLSFTQIGLITLAFQMVGSILQPVIGLYTDRHPQPQSLAFGMGITLCGLILLALASSYFAVLLAAGLVGLGSAIFHPESSRMARLASGGRHGFAQSLFQVGGNAGTSLGPLLAAWIIVPHGQKHILLFTLLAFAGIIILWKVGAWYTKELAEATGKGRSVLPGAPKISQGKLVFSFAVLLALMFSKFFYLAAFTSYYTFYLIERFAVPVEASQLYLFLFLFAGAVGTLAGGALGDRIGRKMIIWISILGMAPFALAIPYANLPGTALLSVIVAFIMASAFPAILVYATELLPGKVGAVAGLFFGLAFGLAGIGSAILGKVADLTNIIYVMWLCSFLPLIGLLTGFLPELKDAKCSKPIL